MLDLLKSLIIKRPGSTTDDIFGEIKFILEQLMLKNKMLEHRIDKLEDCISKLIVDNETVNVGSETGIEDTEKYKL